MAYIRSLYISVTRSFKCSQVIMSLFLFIAIKLEFE